jgi:hypothetical protein
VKEEENTMRAKYGPQYPFLSRLLQLNVRLLLLPPLLVAALILGFLWAALPRDTDIDNLQKADQSQKQLISRLQGQVSEDQFDRSLAALSTRLVEAHMNVLKGNYIRAKGITESFFDDLQELETQAPDEMTRGQLRATLAAREVVISSLSRKDRRSRYDLLDLYFQLQPAETPEP